MPDRIVMIGSGGHARVLLQALRLNGISLIGVIDKQPPQDGFPASYLGNDAELDALDRTLPLVMGIGGTRSVALRRSLFEHAKGKGFGFWTVVHPSAVLADDVKLGEGAQIMAGAIAQPGTRIGSNVIVNTGAIIDHDSLIGDHVHIAPGATLAGHTTVGESTLVGTGARLIPGVKVGAGTQIGAGTVVTRNMPDGVLAYGVPCKIIGAARP